MKDYILEQIKYRELAGENKKDILFDLYCKDIIDRIDYLNNISDIRYNKKLTSDKNIDFYDGIVTYSELVGDFTKEIADKLLNIFEKLINDEENYYGADNYRIAEIGNKKYEQLYNKALINGCCGFYDEQYEINNKKFKLGFNYGH
jgi:hypothetical protein